MFSLDQKLTLESFHRHLLVVFLAELAFLNQMSVFSRNWNHRWKCRDQKEIFQIVMVIIFWDFPMF